MNVYNWVDGKLQVGSLVLPGQQQARTDAAAPPPPDKPKRQYVQSFERHDVVSKSKMRQVYYQLRFGAQLNSNQRFVPVSFVAKDWKVTPRRIRSLLAAGRLAGRVQENGYWEVLYPYFLSLGTRGPALKQQQRVAAKAERRAE
jgi:hypothetical protein